MAKGKVYRRFIRVGGKVQASPGFSRKADADRWYEKELRVKRLIKGGLEYTSGEMTFMEYSRKFINDRLKTHGYATWVSDEQRLRDYLLPELSELPIQKITPQKIKVTLKKITDKGLSVSTRDRVKALASAIFNAALSEDPPLVLFNPVSQVKFQEKRRGKKKPVYFPHADEVSTFLGNAKKLGPKYLAYACIAVMTGLRKSEMIALKWKDIDFDHGQILVSKRVIQASLKIETGTKQGEDTSRIVRINAAVMSALKAWREDSEFSGEDDFVFYAVGKKIRGRFVNPRTLSDWHSNILKGLKRHVTVHGLRHTFGREFVRRGGPIKRLQAILGHSSLAATSIYSDLADETHDDVADLVTFKIEEKDQKSRIGDTAMTQKRRGN